MSQFENKPDRQTSLQANEDMLKVNNKDTIKKCQRRLLTAAFIV